MGTTQDEPGTSPARPGVDRKSSNFCRPASRDRAGPAGPSGFRRMRRRRKLSGPALPRPGNSLSDSAYVSRRACRRLGHGGAIRKRRTIGKAKTRFQYGRRFSMWRRRTGTERRCLGEFKGLAADATIFRRLYFFRRSRFCKSVILCIKSGFDNNFENQEIEDRVNLLRGSQRLPAAATET